MTNETFIPWFAGLFEGEGSFGFCKERPKRLALASTDKDVLERIQQFAGGNIYNSWRKEGKEHWKDAYVWHLSGHEALKLAKTIMPLLLSRRQNRGNEWINKYEQVLNKKNISGAKHIEMAKEFVKLANSGLTHQQIANQFGYDRSHVSKMIKKWRV